MRILKACEVDILADGSLDLPDAILAELHLRVCAIHYKFDLTETEQTERVIRAMDNPYFNILAHPTGRLLGERAAYPINLERILKVLVDRLDLPGQASRIKAAGDGCVAAVVGNGEILVPQGLRRLGHLGKLAARASPFAQLSCLSAAAPMGLRGSWLHRVRQDGGKSLSIPAQSTAAGLSL